MPALPLTVPLGEREPAFSYLSRLAARNRATPSELCSDLGLPFTAIHRGEAEALSALAAVGGIDPDELMSWTPRRIDGREVLFRGFRMTASRFKANAWRGCPECLADDVARGGTLGGYARAEWGHELCFVCLEHRCELVELGSRQREAQQHDIARDLMGRGRLPAAEQVEPDPADIWFRERLDGRSSASWLDSFDFGTAVDFCDGLGRTILQHDLPRSGALTRRDLHRAFVRGFAIANQGADCVLETLRQWHETETTYVPGPRRRLAPLFDMLEKSRDEAGHEQLRSMLREHVFDTWPLPAGHVILGKALPTRRTHSVATAARETGYSAKCVRAVLAAHGHVRPEGEGKSDAREIMAAQRVEPLLRKIRDSVGTKKISAMLGLSYPQLVALRSSGHLLPDVDAGDHRPRWDIENALGWLRALSRSTVPIDADDADWISIQVAARRSGKPPGWIVDRILNGELREIGLRKGLQGYGALVVREGSVLPAPPISG